MSYQKIRLLHPDHSRSTRSFRGRYLDTIAQLQLIVVEYELAAGTKISG